MSYRERTWACWDCGVVQVQHRRRYCQVCLNRHQRRYPKPPADDPLWHTPEHERRVQQLQQLRGEE